MPKPSTTQTTKKKKPRVVITAKRSVFFLLLLLIFLGSGTRVFAHLDAEPQGDVKALLVEPDLFPAGILLPLWFEITNTQTGEHLLDLAPQVEILDPAGQAAGGGSAALRGEEYLFEYEFPRIGDYALRLTFAYQGSPYEFEFTVPVSASETAGQTNEKIILWWTVGIAAALFIAVWLWGLLSHPQRLKRSIILSAVIVILAVLGYSVAVTVKTGAIKTGVVTCLEDGQCYWTAHIHAFFPISICGQELRLPIERGRLDLAHTHEEKNLSHWHDRLPYNPQTKEILETQPLLVKSFFEQIEIPFSNAGIADKQNGNACPDGSTGTLKAFVNGTYTPDIENYIWQDRDVIQIFFDARDIGEIEQDIRANPVSFPVSGRG